jgi:ABC-type nitrate/sulfonate/bicarbonate transport system permease component
LFSMLRRSVILVGFGFVAACHLGSVLGILSLLLPRLREQHEVLLQENRKLNIIVR